MLYAGVIFFLALQFLRPQEFIEVIKGWRLVLAAMIVLVPIWAVTLQWKKILRTPIDLFCFAFYGACVLSWLNYWPIRTLSAGGPAVRVGKIFLGYLLVAHALETRRKLVGGVWMIMLMLLLVGLLGHEIQTGPTAGQYGSIGMFNNRNDFAYAMSMLIPVGLAFVLAAGPLGKVVGLGAFVLGTIQIYITESRGGALAAMAAAYAVLVTLPRSKIARTILVVLGIAGVLIPFMFSKRLQSIGRYRRDKSVKGRLEIWSDCLTRFKRHPVIGHGAMTWQDLPDTPRDTHSSYMRVIVELGSVGLFAFVGMLFYALRTSHKLSRAPPHPTIRVVALSMTGIIVGQIVGGLFQTRVYYPFVYAALGVASALAVVASREEGELAEPTGRPELPADALSGLSSDLWERSRGAGFRAPGLVHRKDLVWVGGLAFACLLIYWRFLIFSF
ncbi:MAG: O-antigen ligase family protein [bacterium]